MLDKLRKSPTIIAIVGTAFVYLLGYVYQSAYLRYFDISSVEIEVSVNNLVIASIGLFFILYIFDNLAEIYRAFLRGDDPNKPSHRYARALLRVSFGLFITLAYFYSLKMPGMPVIAITFGVVFVLFAAEPLIYLEKKKGISHALKKMYDKKDAEVKDAKKYTSYSEKFNTYLVGAFFLFAAASIGGHLHASFLTQFYVFSEKGPAKELIVLKNGDTFVTKSYNTNTHTFDSGYTVQKMQDTLKMDKMQQIGN